MTARRVRGYRPPPRPPVQTPVPMRHAKAGMDADPSGDRPSTVVDDDEAAQAVARLLGWSTDRAAGADDGTLPEVRTVGGGTT